MYKYEDHRHKIFTDDGQREFLKVRDNVNRLLEDAGAFKITKAFKGLSGNGWTLMAYVDRLVELREIEELTNEYVAGQDRIFIKAK